MPLIKRSHKEKTYSLSDFLKFSIPLLIELGGDSKNKLVGELVSGAAFLSQLVIIMN